MSHHYDAALSVVSKLKTQGHTTFLAGGWVRDYLMDHPSDDIDIVTQAPIEEIQRLFAKTIPVGAAFGIIIVVEKGHQFEVATFRQDKGYLDGRRPTEISRATPEQDAQRRDFTINGMFYDPLKQKLYDYVRGQEDLKRGVIRAIGNPHERFLEDRLRMIRAVRYASRFHFSIESKTLQAILDHASALFPAVAIERVWNELIKMALFPSFNCALITLHRLNLLPTIFPSLQNISTEAVQERVAKIPHFPEQVPVIGKVLELFPSYSLAEKEMLATYLKLPKRDFSFIRYYHSAQEILSSCKPRENYDWAKIYAHPHYPLCLQLVALHLPREKREAFLQKHHLQYNNLQWAILRLQNNAPILTSRDLRKVGVKDGPKMGQLLREGERLSINEGLKEAPAILNRLLRPPPSNEP